MKKVSLGLCAALLLASSAIQPAQFDFNADIAYKMNAFTEKAKLGDKLIKLAAEYKFATDFYIEAQTHGKATRDIGPAKMFITYDKQADLSDISVAYITNPIQCIEEIIKFVRLYNTDLSYSTTFYTFYVLPGHSVTVTFSPNN